MMDVILTEGNLKNCETARKIAVGEFADLGRPFGTEWVVLAV